MKSLADLHNALELTTCTTDYRAGAEWAYHWLTQPPAQPKLPPDATIPDSEWAAPHAMTPTPTPALDRDKVEMPISFTIDMCEGTADAVQYRIDRAIERDGSLEAARTGAGMGFGFSLMTQIVGTLQNAAKDLASLRAQLSVATERADQMQRARAELSDKLNGTP